MFCSCGWLNIVKQIKRNVILSDSCWFLLQGKMYVINFFTNLKFITFSLENKCTALLAAFGALLLAWKVPIENCATFLRILIGLSGNPLEIQIQSCTSFLDLLYNLAFIAGCMFYFLQLHLAVLSFTLYSSIQIPDCIECCASDVIKLCIIWFYWKWADTMPVGSYSGTFSHFLHVIKSLLS